MKLLYGCANNHNLILIMDMQLFQVIFHKLAENVLQDTEYVCKLRSYISDIIDSNSEHTMQVCYLLQLLERIHQGFH